MFILSRLSCCLIRFNSQNLQLRCSMAHKAHKAHKGHKGHKARLTSGATKQFVSSNFWIQRKCVCTALEPGYSLQQALLSTRKNIESSVWVKNIRQKNTLHVTPRAKKWHMGVCSTCNCYLGASVLRICLTVPCKPAVPFPIPTEPATRCDSDHEYHESKWSKYQILRPTISYVLCFWGASTLMLTPTCAQLLAL